MTQLRFCTGFDWGRVAWGRPDSSVRPFCAYCSAFIDEDEVRHQTSSTSRLHRKRRCAAGRSKTPSPAVL
jgi:hypothetical protein